MPSVLSQGIDLIVVGGGAAGFMAAITAAERGSSVVLLEGTAKPLEKVRISGGGRCNVTNACWNPQDLVNNYPRGRLPLLGPFTRFATGDAFAWFADRGVDLVVEEDGRVFPLANSSSAIIECLKNAAKKAGVQVLTRQFVNAIRYVPSKGYLVDVRKTGCFFSQRVLLATGGHPSGFRLAASLGHDLIPPLPSLFTFALDAPWLISCSGIAVNNVSLKLCLDNQSFDQFGRVLLTHWGLSGPAVLRMTAFAARALHSYQYKAVLNVNWLGIINPKLVKQTLKEYRYKEARKIISSARPFSELSKKLWLAILQQVGINPLVKWADFSASYENRLFNALVSSDYMIRGKGPFGEEFVTAGGVNLKNVNLVNMESRICPGLYFAGELLDIDGLTGGFNFQHCWTSGWLAGNAIANNLK